MHRPYGEFVAENIQMAHLDEQNSYDSPETFQTLRSGRYISCNETPCLSLGQWKNTHFLKRRGDEHVLVTANFGSSAGTSFCHVLQVSLIPSRRRRELLRVDRKQKYSRGPPKKQLYRGSGQNQDV